MYTMWCWRRKIRGMKCILVAVSLPISLFVFFHLATTNIQPCHNDLTEAKFGRQTGLAPAHSRHDIEEAITNEHSPYLEQLQRDLHRTFEDYGASKLRIERLLNSTKLGTGYRLKFTQKKMINEPVPRCTESPFLLIEIHSNPVKFLWREAIRLSWGRQDNNANKKSWSTKGRYGPD